MNKNETYIILNRLKQTYETFEHTVQIAYQWQEAFKKDSYKAVDKAVTEFIKDNPANAEPTINKIRAYMRRPFNQKFYDNRKWIWKLEAVKETLPSGAVIEKTEAVRHEMQYTVDKHGDIVDELGRIYADPDEETQKQLINKVRATGRLV